MRNKVIKFLASLPEAPEDQFNEALLLYMKSPVPNPGLVRSYNQQGYSPQRLNELVYDLKKAFDISNSEIVVVPKVVDKKSTASDSGLPEGFPEFSKGPVGNQERKAYLAEHNITSDSFKNVDMDAAIKAHLLKEAGNKVLTEAAKKMQVNVVDEDLVAEVKALIESKSPITDELAVKINSSNESTKIEIGLIIGSAADKQRNEKFEKVVALITAGEVPPVSLIREIYNDTEMSDENAKAILEEATALVNSSANQDTDSKVDEILKELASKQFKKEDLTDEFKKELQEKTGFDDEKFSVFMKQIESITTVVDEVADKVLKSKKQGTDTETSKSEAEKK
ncbi:hypothetical protein CJ739_84 [Mariniflexile rhizosphaerae]|uniref:hypothetical protein n=1 Tax=unclassified Mariniflexile TaxID=2643887 RepID=UPI000E32F479|nr:hypothetical protein [Mariniflexile sp. TRM1-10]AXP79184.1 hypothetical protein CJ739_84 [Mariniflexile sp. TRM1-10]